MLYLIDRERATTGKDTPNLFVLVAEDPGLDAAIGRGNSRWRLLFA